ncbi:hypothetical protein [Flavobacterium taihuense]|uniref:Uncharacterized protein n=1 Tax=Flavobacterium taihuense TaxID=2857508 RepID=A0ABS6XTL7_9FLAO|nr:hypothetical protein [Flavobacterium taihuense]MBW4360014.1 hypothetical protein [Flavobacterium taihuense]
MGSIYDKADNAAMIARINSLTAESKPLWGKMTVDQMCKHCNTTIQLHLVNKGLKSIF